MRATLVERSEVRVRVRVGVKSVVKQYTECTEVNLAGHGRGMGGPMKPHRNRISDPMLTLSLTLP